MVHGLNSFKKWFKGYEDNYVVIGGMACDLLMENAGLDFRATKDVDMVLIIESLSKEFCARFWDYIGIAGYEIREKSNGKPCFYRFQKPKSNEYPVMIELFARKPDWLIVPNGVHLAPFHVDDEVSSLSAILLDEEYYNILKDGKTEIEGVSVLDVQQIVLFKIKAWKDLLSRGAESNKYKKHKNDIFRLAQLLNNDSPLVVSRNIKDGLDEFVKTMRNESVDLKAMNVVGQKEDLLDLLEENYVVEKAVQ